MEIRYLEQEQLMQDFLPLVAELECGSHYDPLKQQHVDWLRRRVAALYAIGGVAICLYSNEGRPLGFLFLLHDPGLEGAKCFGKKASIAMFGLFSEYRLQGLGASLLGKAEEYVTQNGGECLYVDTYAGNVGAIRYYTKQGFIPVAYHIGENGLDDDGQVYMFKNLRDRISSNIDLSA